MSIVLSLEKTLLTSAAKDALIFTKFLFVTASDSNLLSKPPLMKTRSEDSQITSGSMSPKVLKSTRHQGGKSDASDIHICVLCLKALMNNAVSAELLVFPLAVVYI